MANPGESRTTIRYIVDQSDGDKLPRWWPSLVLGIGVLPLIGVVAQIAIRFAMGHDPISSPELTDEVVNAWMNSNMVTAKGFLSIMIPIHAAMAILALGAATFSRTPLKKRLGLVRGSAPLWQYPILGLASLGTSALAGWLFLTHITVPPEVAALTQAFTKTTGVDGAVHVWYGIVPGFAEELVFRGFVLIGLLRRWKPAYALALVSVLFAVSHPNPYFMLAAFLPGLWWGIIVWRTGSLWPAIACHAFSYIALALLNRWYPEPTGTGFFGVLTTWPIVTGIVCVIFLGISIWLLFRKPPAAVPRT